MFYVVSCCPFAQSNLSNTIWFLSLMKCFQRHAVYLELMTEKGRQLFSRNSKRFVGLKFIFLLTTLGDSSIVRNCKPLELENVCLGDSKTSRDNETQISKSPVIFWFLQTACFMSFTFPGAASRSSKCFCEFFSFNGYNVMSISCEAEQTLDVTEKENSSLTLYISEFCL